MYSKQEMYSTVHCKQMFRTVYKYIQNYSYISVVHCKYLYADCSAGKYAGENSIIVILFLPSIASLSTNHKLPISKIFLYTANIDSLKLL